MITIKNTEVLENYLEKVLDNLDTINTTNKIKAQVLAIEFVNIFSKQEEETQNDQ